ncbi:hypothetical protein RQP46_003277 [Phenoliferia psychrophenolica]
MNFAKRDCRFTGWFCVSFTVGVPLNIGQSAPKFLSFFQPDTFRILKSPSQYIYYKLWEQRNDGPIIAKWKRARALEHDAWETDRHSPDWVLEQSTHERPPTAQNAALDRRSDREKAFWRMMANWPTRKKVELLIASQSIALLLFSFYDFAVRTDPNVSIDISNRVTFAGVAPAAFSSCLIMMGRIWEASSHWHRHLRRFDADAQPPKLDPKNVVFYFLLGDNVTQLASIVTLGSVPGLFTPAGRTCEAQRPSSSNLN